MSTVKFENVSTEQATKLSELYGALKGVGIGEFSDGYHTFNELYHHRAILFSVICNTYQELAWKSKQHHDPGQPMYDGMFIVGIQTPEGQATYHYDLDPYWDLFRVKELDKAPEWDGHTPDDAIKRIASLKTDTIKLYNPYDPDTYYLNHELYVKATLMWDDCTGHIYVPVSGCCGRDALTCIDFEDYVDYENDCDLCYHENGDYFTVTLRNEKGHTFCVEGDGNDLNRMIVGIEFVESDVWERAAK